MIIITGENITIRETKEQKEQDFNNFGEYLQAIARAQMPRDKYINGIECGRIDKRLAEYWREDKEEMEKELRKFYRTSSFEDV